MEPEIITEAQTWLTNNQGLIIEYAVNIAAALITLLVGYIAANLLSGGVVKVMQTRKLDTTVTHFVGSILKYTILVFVVIAVAYFAMARKSDDGGTLPKGMAWVAIAISVILAAVCAHSYMMPARPACIAWCRGQAAARPGRRRCGRG